MNEDKEEVVKLDQDVSKEDNTEEVDEEHVGVGEDSKGNEAEKGGRKKRHRPHRKKPWGLALRDMELRVISK